MKKYMAVTQIDRGRGDGRGVGLDKHSANTTALLQG